MKNRVSFAIEPDGLDFLHRRTGQEFRSAVTPLWFCCTVFSPTGWVRAACLGEFKTPFEVHFTVAIAEPEAITRKLLRVVFKTLFTRAVRIVGMVEPHNVDAIQGARRLGFQYAGFARRGLDGNKDALIFDMLREDCPWLPNYQGGTIIYKEPDYGIRTKSA